MEWESDPEFDKEWEERLLAARGPDPEGLPDLVPQQDEPLEEGALPPRVGRCPTTPCSMIVRM